MTIKHLLFQSCTVLVFCSAAFCFQVDGSKDVVKQAPVSFLSYLTSRLAEQRKTVQQNGKTFEAKIELNALCPVYSKNPGVQKVTDRVLREYGALFVGENNSLAGLDLYNSNAGLSLTAQCVFLDEAAVQRYQGKVTSRRESVGGTVIELEAKAMESLLRARQEALSRKLTITPRGGKLAAKRSYADTKRLWDSRFFPGLQYWVARRVISPQEAERLKSMKLIDQVANVLEFEQSRKAYFSKDLKKSILYSVAPPGASQHLYMLAVDISEFANREVRKILAENGWHQTVRSDLPHFTYLGISDRAELEKRGLKVEVISGQEFWTPRIE